MSNLDAEFWDKYRLIERLALLKEDVELEEIVKGYRDLVEVVLRSYGGKFKDEKELAIELFKRGKISGSLSQEIIDLYNTFRGNDKDLMVSSLVRAMEVFEEVYLKRGL